LNILQVLQEKTINSQVISLAYLGYEIVTKLVGHQLFNCDTSK